MPIRCAITKVSGQGEQIVVDVAQWNPVTGAIVHSTVDEMAQLMDQMLKFADARLEEMNLRMLEAYNLEGYFEPGTWQRVISILDILCGRQSAAMVRQRWDSIKEENAALAQGRIDAMLRHTCSLENEQIEPDLHLPAFQGSNS